MPKAVSLDQARPGHMARQSNRVLKRHFRISGVVDEEHGKLKMLEVGDAVDLSEAQPVSTLETRAQRFADRRCDPQPTREVAGVFVDRGWSADERDASKPAATAKRDSDRCRPQRMADRSRKRSVGESDRLKRVDEVRKGDGCLPTLAVPGMIEPDHPESSGQEWSNQAAHLQATTAPTVDQQRTRGVGRPRLPNCKGVLAYDN